MNFVHTTPYNLLMKKIFSLFLEPTYSLDNNDLLRQIHDLFFKLHAEIEQANRDLQQNVEKQLTQANDQIDTSFKTTGKLNWLFVL